MSSTNTTESRAAVLLAMVQALSVKQGYECLGTEDDRRLLACMGPEEKFKALQIEFIALTYRLETREMELRGTMEKLDEVTKENTALQMLHSVESKRAFEEEVVAKYTKSHAEEVLKLTTALENDRQKLKNTIDSDLLHHIPMQKAVTLEELLLAAGLKAKDSSTRSRLHALLAEHRESSLLYPMVETDSMVKKVKAFAKDNATQFDTTVPTPITKSFLLPWESTSSSHKRKHPVDKVWDSALEAIDQCRTRR